MRIAKGFNLLAPFYTLLTRLIFGKSLEHSQKHFLNSIKPDDRILILGGGSGTLLKDLLELQPTVTVDYIDISIKMIELARKKNGNPLNVTFIVGTEQSIPSITYTVVITNFYLDLFSGNSLKTIIPLIKSHLADNGQWLVTDFVSKKSWHKMMLWMMYRFFRITTGIEAKTLPGWENQLRENGLKESEFKNFFGGFIKSIRLIPPLSSLGCAE